MTTMPKMGCSEHQHAIGGGGAAWEALWRRGEGEQRPDVEKNGATTPERKGVETWARMSTGGLSGSLRCGRRRRRVAGVS